LAEKLPHIDGKRVMPAHRKSVPTYRLHKPSGSAVVTIRDKDGRRRDVRLGAYNSPESRAAYRSLLTELVKSQQKKEPAPAVAAVRRRVRGTAVSSLAINFLQHARTYYRTSAGPSSEYSHFTTAIGLMLSTEVDGVPIEDLPIGDFGLLHLDAVRESMIAAGWRRQTVNSQVRRVRAVFRWGEERGLVEPGTWFALRTLSGLRAGRTSAAEQSKVEPVPDEHIDRTLPHLTPTVAAMVRFQRLTACRPAEVCGLAWEHIDTSGSVWVYRPPHHKTRHHGHAREIWVGPAAQAVLLARGEPQAAGQVFTPSAAVAEQQAARRAKRATKLYPSHERHLESKRALAPQRRPSEKWTTGAYIRSIAGGCRRAGVPPWSPNQVRHTALTAIRKSFGLETAQLVAGHQDAATTTIYAEQDKSAAIAAIEQMG
jgi:integrase